MSDNPAGIPSDAFGGGGSKEASFDWWNQTPVKGQFGSDDVLSYFLSRLGLKLGQRQESFLSDLLKSFDPTLRQKRQFDQLVAYTQKLWRISEPVRKQFFAKADDSSPEKWEQSTEAYREQFHSEL